MTYMFTFIHIVGEHAFLSSGQSSMAQGKHFCLLRNGALYGIAVMRCNTAAIEKECDFFACIQKKFAKSYSV